MPSTCYRKPGVAMKISAQDEYGIRVLIRIAREETEDGLSIAQLCEAEGLSQSYMAKVTRSLRMAGLIESTRGRKGGYILGKPADQIRISEVLDALGGALYDDSFCRAHTGGLRICTNSVDCSVRSLWRIVQVALDRMLDRITLADLLGSEDTSDHILQHILDESIAAQPEESN